MKKFSASEFRKRSEEARSSAKSLKFKEVSMGEISNRRLVAIITVVFVLFVIFSGDSPVIRGFQTKLNIHEINNEIEDLREEIKRDCVVIDGIKNNKVYLIRYAREKLYFTQKGEDVYITEE